MKRKLPCSQLVSHSSRRFGPWPAKVVYSPRTLVGWLIVRGSGRLHGSLLVMRLVLLEPQKKTGQLARHRDPGLLPANPFL